MRSIIKKLPLLLLFSFFCFADVKQNSPELVVHLLDYLANDYKGAVQNGKVINSFEYQEQIEFIEIIESNSKGSPKLSFHPAFLSSVHELKNLIHQKSSADRVSQLARTLQQDAIRLSEIEVAPSQWPDLDKAATIYRVQCASCHGQDGAGDGVAGKGLDPSPSNFLDKELAWNSSPYKFYNTIRLGVPGTGMAAFSHLSDEDVWALAFYAKSLPYKTIEISPAPTDLSLKDLATRTDSEIADKLGKTSKDIAPIIASLRNQKPQHSPDDFISRAEELLDESLRAAQDGKYDEAHKLAVRAYLEGVELLEPKLQANAPKLVVEIESLMISFRSALSQQQNHTGLASKRAAISKTFEKIRETFSQNKMSAALAFGAVFSIFLREGFEAILILTILISVLRALGQPQAVKWVHVGWASAVLVGVGAWFATGLLLSLSGLDREVMEGSIALFAVAVLIYVGFWLHRYSEIQKWKQYLEKKLKHGLSAGSYFGIATISFMAVFREAFEVVLFLRTIWLDLETTHQNVAGFGILCAVVVLTTLSYIVIRQSRKIPLGSLFQICSWTMIFLALILTGKGVHSLQEAGLVSVSVLDWIPRLDLLGLYPNLQTVLAQLSVVIVFSLLFVLDKRKSY